MPQKQPLVSINLLTWNGQKYIRDCLNSVFNQTYPCLDILVIDNGSTDETVSYLKNLPKKENLRLIFNKKNLGFTGGHNQAIRKSKGQFIVCLNQDMVLDKDFVRKAVGVFRKNKNIAAVQGKLLRWSQGLSTANNFASYEVSRIIDTTGLAILKNRRIINQGQGEIDQGQFNKMTEVFGADGAAPIYRRKALEDVQINGQYFDEDFFNYKEDVDLAWRLRLAGWQTIYQPKSIAWHDRGAGESASISYFGIIRERLKISKFAKYLAFKNQRLMQIKNEQIPLLIKHLPWFLSKEIASWAYVLLLERYTWKAIKDLFKQAPQAWQKRKVIMAGKRVKAREMNRWFI